MVAADLLSRARAGDGEAFRELAESHRRELQVHCYRMLGSFAGAEDAVQETKGIGGFAEERASLRTWLYKIATSRCLNARRAASRRPARERDMSRFGPPAPAPREEAAWLQPFPDPALARQPGTHAGTPMAGTPQLTEDADQFDLSASRPRVLGAGRPRRSAGPGTIGAPVCPPFPPRVLKCCPYRTGSGPYRLGLFPCVEEAC
jgi:DNA-directed RNA polymerase specialized sigma24 family protein